MLETCKQLLSKFGVKPEQYQIGRTKIFFRAGVLGATGRLGHTHQQVRSSAFCSSSLP